ncbi:MAG: cache domain-containing protein, partial [Spirochaetaceae bacterium]|nr:cache domain-containing protein [Spirochaetaceae bacterium]
MKKFKGKIHLIKTIRKITIIIYGVAMLSFAAVGLIDRFSMLRDETDKVRNNYISTQKQIIETQVLSAVQFITLASNSGISKENILKSLSQIRFGNDRDGYIFVNTYDGIPLLLDAEQVINGKSIWNLTDPNGVKVIQKERQASLNPDGDYIHYSWLKLSTNTVSPKISFIKAYPEWHWMIGAGAYLDSVEIEIHKLQKTIIIDTGVKTFLLILIMLFILIAIQYIFKRFITNVETELTIFSSYFDNAAIEN